MPECMRERIRQILEDGEWHTGLSILRILGTSFGTGAMAKIRDLRKPEYGGHTIESRKNVALSRAWNRQVWEYRMVKPVL